jgi:hypothetical protein
MDGSPVFLQRMRIDINESRSVVIWIVDDQ